MGALDKLLVDFGDLLEEMDFPGLELNFDHYLEITKGNDFCDFGMYWLMAYSNTGHVHVVLLPQITKPIDTWPVAYYDQEEGSAHIFASSIRRWFPAYFLRQVNIWYPTALEYGTQFPWVKEWLRTWYLQKKKIIELGNRFPKLDFERLYEDFILMVENETPWDEGTWVQRVEGSSYIGEYHRLKKANATIAEWKSFILKYPFYNQPLADQLEDPEKIDPDLAWEFFNRNLRWDMKYYQIIPGVAKTIVEKAPNTQSPFWPLIKRIYETTKEKKHGYYHGAEGYFAAGEAFEQRGEPLKAITCFENALFELRAETEEYHEDAYDKIVTIAQKIGDPNYLAYLDETMSSSGNEGEINGEDDDGDSEEDE